MAVTVRPTHGPGATQPTQALAIDVEADRGRTHSFTCRLLPGAAPSFLARRLSVGGPWLRGHGDAVAWLESALAGSGSERSRLVEPGPPTVHSLGRFDLTKHLAADPAVGEDRNELNELVAVKQRAESGIRFLYTLWN